MRKALIDDNGVIVGVWYGADSPPANAVTTGGLTDFNLMGDRSLVFANGAWASSEVATVSNLARRQRLIDVGFTGAQADALLDS